MQSYCDSKILPPHGRQNRAEVHFNSRYLLLINVFILPGQLGMIYKHIFLYVVVFVPKNVEQNTLSSPTTCGNCHVMSLRLELRLDDIGSAPRPLSRDLLDGPREQENFMKNKRTTNIKIPRQLVHDSIIMYCNITISRALYGDVGWHLSLL